MTDEAVHHVYMLKCQDDTFYVGYTTDIVRRLREHNTSSKGAKYTRGRRPVKLVYYTTFTTKSAALKHEHVLRKQPRKEKERLTQTFEGKLNF
ncbi:MAG: GIY-YIG nuclease family protein [Defluviitaleaceae bacterium]|nr:GIY-YIG nuclease family protein [Defluviitaleaceae bacterium]